MHAYLLLLFAGWAAAQSTGNLRLVRNGFTSSSYTSGRLEIYYSGQWGTVCDDFWDSTNTRVACRQLGFSSSSLRRWTTSSSGGFGSAPSSRRIWLDNVNCFGTESRLSSCSRNLYGSTDCVHSEDVAIYCSTSTTSSPSTSTGSLRLVRNGFSSSSYSSGRLEIYYSGQWGTVCDDFWDSTNTRVACRQLGFSSFSLTSWTRSSSGGFGSAPSSRRIWLDNVNCFGSESRLSSCSRNSYGNTNCVHSEDVAISCTSTSLTGTNTVTGTVTNIVGIAVGVSVAGFVLFVVIPIAICVIVGIAAAVSSSRRSRLHTAVTTTAPAPTTTATVVTSAQQQQQSNTAQGYPAQPYPAQPYPAQPYPAAGTDFKQPPPYTYTGQPMEMSAYPPQAAYPPGKP